MAMVVGTSKFYMNMNMKTPARLHCINSFSSCAIYEHTTCLPLVWRVEIENILIWIACKNAFLCNFFSLGMGDGRCLLRVGQKSDEWNVWFSGENGFWKCKQIMGYEIFGAHDNSFLIYYSEVFSSRHHSHY